MFCIPLWRKAKSASGLTGRRCGPATGSAPCGRGRLRTPGDAALSLLSRHQSVITLRQYRTTPGRPGRAWAASPPRGSDHRPTATTWTQGVEVAIRYSRQLAETEGSPVAAEKISTTGRSATFAEPAHHIGAVGRDGPGQNQLEEGCHPPYAQCIRTPVPKGRWVPARAVEGITQRGTCQSWGKSQSPGGACCGETDER